MVSFTKLHSDDQSRGLSWWMLWILGSALVLYFFAFAVLVLFPQAAKAAVAVGLSEGVLETIFYPIMRLIGR